MSSVINRRIRREIPTLTCWTPTAADITISSSEEEEGRRLIIKEEKSAICPTDFTLTVRSDPDPEIRESVCHDIDGERGGRGGPILIFLTFKEAPRGVCSFSWNFRPSGILI